MSFIINTLFPHLIFSEAWIWPSLFGLLMPVIIHLLSKREKTIVSFGSLRFLQTHESENARSIQLSQYLLLILRLLLIGIVCVFLSGPMLERDDERNVSYWIEEGIDNNGDYEEVIKALPVQSKINVFSHVVPNSLGVNYFESAWTLIDYLNKRKDSSVVYTYSLQKHFIGQPVSPRPVIDWKVFPYKSQQKKSQYAGNGTQTIEWSLLDDPDRIGVQTRVIDNSDYKASRTLKLELIEADLNADVALFKKVIELSKEYLYYDIEWLSNEGSDQRDWKVIIGPEGKFTDGSLSRYNEGPTILWIPNGQRLSIETGGENELHIIGKIDRESILDTNLPVIIASYFNKYYTSIMDSDTRVLHPGKMKVSIPQDYPEIAASSIVDSNQPLQSYLLLLIVPILLAERFLNFKMKEKS